MIKLNWNYHPTNQPSCIVPNLSKQMIKQSLHHRFPTPVYNEVEFLLSFDFTSVYLPIEATFSIALMTVSSFARNRMPPTIFMFSSKSKMNGILLGRLNFIMSASEIS